MREISQADTPTGIWRRKEPADLRLRLFRPLFRPGSQNRYPQRPACPARPLDRRARRYRGTGRSELRIWSRTRHRQGARRTALPRPAPQAVARQGRQECQQMHYARQGIITPEMEFVAIRENNNRRAYIESLKVLRRKWAKKWPKCSAASTPARTSAPASRKKSPRNSCAAKSPAAAPSSPTTSTTRKASR
jgi:hypothetical protein